MSHIFSRFARYSNTVEPHQGDMTKNPCYPGGPYLAGSQNKTSRTQVLSIQRLKLTFFTETGGFNFLIVTVTSSN